MPPAAAAAVSSPASGAFIQVNYPQWLLQGSYGAASYRRGARSPDAPAVTHAWSQDEEDIFTYRTFFFGDEGGTVLEVGGLDGKLFSVSAMFEQQLGWRAILIEAGNRFNAIGANRPDALALHFAVCAAARTVHYIDGELVPAARKTGDLAPVGGILEFMSSVMLTQYFPSLISDSLVSAAGAVLDAARLAQHPFVTALRCEPPAQILRRLGITHINFWSLDVEGAELEVLKAFDFAVISVDVIMVEVMDTSKPAWVEMQSILARAGFEFYPTGRDPNYWFKHSSFERHAQG